MQSAMREVVNLQVTMGCDKRCEPCSKYFDCSSPLRQNIYDLPALQKIKKRLASVRHTIAVMSGKGGVGKSTVSCNLASVFASMGFKVGVLDSDFYGPSVPTILGVNEQRFQVVDEGILPIETKERIKVASVGTAIPRGHYVTWMGDQIRWALYQFLGTVIWGELDFLIIDLPPGTGEETTNVMKAIPRLSGGVIVTIPSEVSQIVVERGIKLCEKAGTTILGLIENMGTMECPVCHTNIDVFMKGGGKRVAEAMGVRYLGYIPLDVRVSHASDMGYSFVLKYPESEASKAFRRIAMDIASQLGASVSS